MKEQLKQFIQKVREEGSHRWMSDIRPQAMDRAFDSIEKALDDFSPWISVEDVAPKTYRDKSGKMIVYLFCDINDAEPMPIYGKYMGEHKFLTLGGVEKEGTHYMEVPQPPKSPKG